MRPFASNLRTHHHARQPALQGPLFRTSHQTPPDPAAARRARNHQSANLRAWLGLQMVSNSQVDPAHHFVPNTGHQNNVILPPAQRLDPPPHRLDGARIAQFPTQRRRRGCIVASDFANCHHEIG